jgi:hypothetical protein
MAKNSITDYDNIANNNTDIQSVDIAENCAPSGINNAIRELMADLADVNDGTVALTSPKAGSVTTDTISESTTGNGVAVDGMTIKDGAVGTTASPATANLTSINGGQIGGRRNMLFNGDMRIWQRSTSQAYGSGAQNAYLTADRWKTTRNNGSSVTQAQSTDAPDGFANSFGLTVTTADGTLDAGDYEYNAQYLEGYDVQHLKYGTADAKPVTVSFWVKCSLTGDFALNLYAAGSSANYNIGTTVTINSANTWEYKTVTFAGLTTDTIPNDNALRFGIFFYTTAGSTWTSTDNTSWDVYSSGRLAYGQTLNLSGTLGATFKVTGFQLEVGEVATEFEVRSYGEEFALCQRYYIKNDRWNIWSGYAANTANYFENAEFPTTMRTAPTVSTTRIGSSGFAIADPTAQQQNKFGFYAYSTCNATVISGYFIFNYTADAEL